MNDQSDWRGGGGEGGGGVGSEEGGGVGGWGGGGGGHKPRRLFSKPIRSKEERNGPPSANRGLSTAKTGSSHAVCTTHPPPLLSPNNTIMNICTQSTTMQYLMQSIHQSIKF